LPATTAERTQSIPFTVPSELVDRLTPERLRKLHAGILHQLRLLTHGGKVHVRLDVRTGGTVSAAKAGHEVDLG
jgi:hypothetical protein